MSSILGLHAQGSDVTVLITKVHLHPLCVLVEFWGNFSQERKEDYECLARDIQSPGNTFKEFEGNPGDECLVQIDGTWYRSRIVTRNGSKYTVFLIDKGVTYSTTTSKLAWGKKKHFILPPEVEFCVLANVLPLSPENRWSPVALEFLRSLSGKTVKAHVQDVLVPNRTFILHIPCISKQMYEMGIAKKLSSDLFQNFVLTSLQSHSRAEVFPETLQISVGAGERLHNKELFMYPELPAGTVETVIVTDVTNPQRIFCQLKVFSQELKKLSEQITQCCEGRMTNCIVSQEMIGFPCAARGSDGRWYRSILQQVFPNNKVVEVLNVDYGTKQFVQVENVRPLAAEFFRMPVVTYICSLHGIIDKGVGWTTNQIDYLRTLLLYKTVIAKFEYQSISEGVHYVTLYGDENTNLNNLFGSKESCSLESEKTLGDYAIRSTAYSCQHPATQERNQRKIFTPGQAIKEKDGKGKAEKLPTEDLALNSTLVATVQHASDPSDSGLAERAETQREPKTKITTQPAILLPTPLPDARLSGVYSTIGYPFQTLTTFGPASNERRIPTFKEHMFPIGSVLDVNVSYIESPNDFWCQLVQNAGHLKLLMHEIQAHYAGSEFQCFVGTACVARHPDNGMWYRALVINKHETSHVDVLFVDYGQTETVSLYDLRRICPEFLNLHAQAFRCSLLNPVDPMSATNEWNKEAVERFHSFVETAASSFVILKCTIYAVMYNEQKIAFNIVDLETPFESMSTSMVNLVKSLPPKKGVGPSFRLDTYYYSTHNVKTGTEEQVTVTCVNSVGQFYCQLERNADVIKDLMIKVSSLCHQLKNVKLPSVFGALCFAKYTDGQWYRGQIKATKPAILVHFVDYGDTLEVEKSDLLPVPIEANEIMSVPVQAVVCGLSDVPADVPRKVNSWFETSATECKFRALVVAREPDGKLLVELYHRNTQINSKIKKMFQIEMHSEKQVVYQGWRALETPTNHAQKTPKADPKQAVNTEDHTQTAKKNFSAPKLGRQMREADMNLHSAPKPPCRVFENGQRVKAAPLELYIPPHHRQSCGRTPSNTGNGSEAASGIIKPRKESHTTETKQLIKSKSSGTESQKKSDAEKLPKLADLPSKSIMLGMEADVYVSHCKSPFSFYVQLVREEDELFSLAEKLNEPQSIPQTDTIKEVHPGDLVQAEFADDSSCTHCMLSNAAALGNEEVLDPEVTSAFKEDMGGCGEKVLKCQFIKQSGSMWEVSLEDSEVIGRDGDELSVLFVDYGNESQVNVRDVREIPSDLMEAPPQAFLCELEGLNGSQGSWESGAADELSLLTTDKALQLTVTKVTREEGKLKCLVQMECEGLRINDALKTWWKSSTTENEPGAVGPITSYETPLPCDSTVKETAPPQDQLECPESQELDMPCDSGIDESILSPVNNKADQGDKSTVETDEGTEEEGASVIDTTGPDDLDSPLDKNPTEAIDESEITATDLESLPGEVNTSSMESSFDVMIFFGPNEQRDDSEATTTRDNPLISMTTVKMVPREVVSPRESMDPETFGNMSEDLKQPCSLTLTQQPVSHKPAQLPHKIRVTVLKRSK
ncbi:tudor domain-containing 6 [Symphorus nematophorus]